MQELYQVPINERVCRAFAYAASQTWSDLQDYGELGEESITDYRLLLLKRICPQEIQAIKFSKVREGKTGADWEWWFGSGGEWFGMRIQAKRLDIDKLEYSHLDHTIGKSKVLQVDCLLRDAQSRNLYPMYCFYNYWSAKSVSVNWSCKTFTPKQELWGASIADAKKIQRKVHAGEKSLTQIAPISMPLMCLACCKGHVRSGHRTLPHRARGIALVLAGNSEELVPNLTNQLPSYVPRDNSQSTFDIPDDLDGILIVEEGDDLYE